MWGPVLSQTSLPFQGVPALPAAGCLFFTPQSVQQEDAAGPGDGDEVQQDLPVRRKLDLSSDEVETGGMGSLLLSDPLTLVRQSMPWSPADLL